jgi:hypothetical protein
VAPRRAAHAAPQEDETWVAFVTWSAGPAQHKIDDIGADYVQPVWP